MNVQRIVVVQSDALKFTALAASLAIFFDAAVAHAMLWGNDPHWTYWVTDTLLMMTVFGLGTTWLGIGSAKGAALTALHMLLLTIYYWTFSPIGLPNHPEWLDLEHTWLTGLPVHFAVYYLGYLCALWLWRRRSLQRRLEPTESPQSRPAIQALIVSVTVVLLAGGLQALILGILPGATWFIARVAVAFPFTMAWLLLAGTDRGTSLGGGVVLGLLLTSYGHYLGPNGLPNASFRLLSENPPPAAVEWLSYRQEFLIVLPVTVAISIIAFWIASHRAPENRTRESSRGLWYGASAAGLALLGVGFFVAPYLGPSADGVVVRAVGPGTSATASGGHTDLVTATLSMQAWDRNPHRTPLPPHDQVSLEATLVGVDGTTYAVDAGQAMVADPQGRHTTWGGVGLDVWHHGRSGIGATDLPPTKSDVAVYALGSVSKNGTVVATGVPVHLMTSTRAGARLELHVGDPRFPLVGVDDGQLRVIWPDYAGGYDQVSDLARYVWGASILVVLLGGTFLALRRSYKDDDFWSVS